MRTVYLAADPVEAEIVKNLLLHEGIACRVIGQYSFAGRGDLPVDIYPRLLLEDDSRYAEARALIHHWERGPEPAPDWTCDTCGESVDGVFGACWNCSASR